MWIKFCLAGVMALTFSLIIDQPMHADDDAAMADAIAQLEQSLGGELLNNPYTTKWNIRGKRLKRKIVLSEDAPGGSAFQVAVPDRTPEVWEASVKVKIDEDIKKGDEIEIRVWARAEKPMQSLGTGNIDIQLHRDVEPYDNIFSVNVRPGDKWEQFTARGMAARDFDAEQSLFGVNIGYGEQILQFSTIYVIRLSSCNR